MNRQGHHEQTSSWAHTAPGPASFVLLSVLAAAALANSASASPASIERGRRLAEAHCKTCHALTGDKPGPVAGAPPFAEIQNRAPGRSLDEIFAGALASGHPPMPRFVGAPEQQQDLLDYIRSRQTAAPTR